MLNKLKIVLAFALVTQMVTFTACAQKPKKTSPPVLDIKAAEKSTVLLNNQSGLVPLQALERRKIASINIGFGNSVALDSLLSKYASVKRFKSAAYTSPSADFNDLSEDLKFYNTLIIQVTPQQLGNPEVVNFISESNQNKEVVVVGFGALQALQKLENISSPIVWSTENSGAAAQYVAQLIFGGVSHTTKLKQAVSAKYGVGSGYNSEKIRFGYTNPEHAGIKSAALDSIDIILADAIRQHATPGAVLLVAKDGNVIYNKAYGNHTYEGGKITSLSDIYDLASLTKVTATTAAAMRLYEQQKLNLDANMGFYIPKARKTDKKNITVRDLLLHQSGFGWFPFHTDLKPTDYSSDSSYAYPVKVAEKFFLRRTFYDEVIWPKILNSALDKPGTYRYTDMNMYVLKEIIERLSGTPIEEYVQNEFYKSLGMYTAGFTPRRRFEQDQIVPTELDTRFRKSMLQGYVHDEGASLLGGISGHAGLFGSATDVAIFYQMLLNGGSYGGKQYFKPETVKLFTTKQSSVSRRGLGFDRWDPDASKQYPSSLASPETYGHTGFTGTCVWVDPKYNLVYVLLTNRVNPTRNDKLLDLKVRARVQDVIYRAINKK